MLRIKSFGMTDVGLLRTHNEDCFDADDRNQVYIVADGMGGHNHGEVASRVAVDSIREFIAQSVDRDGTLPIGYDARLFQHSNRLKRSIQVAHDRVLTAIREDGKLVGMGTTIIGAMLDSGVVAIAHVGDSRGYRLRHGHLELLTQDHTWVNEQVVAGYLSEEQAKSHPLKNVVTRALGGENEIVVDVVETEALVGDIFLLCSDGLTTMLSDQEIHERMMAGASLSEICHRMVHDANARGGFDNVTVVLLRVVEDRDAAKADELEPTVDVNSTEIADPTP
ncbi:MAG: Stp1/IreP family PP2C-type Ser/Thr phosphatase [bacterium]|nr:Stp1/IreP family PP2C-type Ser/Thr phosphatase [bacterium]